MPSLTVLRQQNYHHVKSRNYATDLTKASLSHNTAANVFERGTKGELYHSQNPALNGLAV